MIRGYVGARSRRGRKVGARVSTRRHGQATTLARRVDTPSLAHSMFLVCASSHALGGDAAAVFAAATDLQD